MNPSKYQLGQETLGRGFHRTFFKLMSCPMFAFNALQPFKPIQNREDQLCALSPSTIQSSPLVAVDCAYNQALTTASIHLAQPIGHPPTKQGSIKRDLSPAMWNKGRVTAMTCSNGFVPQ